MPDCRNPLYLAQLLTRVSELGLRDSFVLLGMVPYRDLFQLMRQSLAVLQPSLFEGWSTTVEEVKSLGKRIILSDIAVHREQDPPAAAFFDPRDEGALAQWLLYVFREGKAGPDLELEAAARAELPERTRRFGRRFMEIAQELV